MEIHPDFAPLRPARPHRSRIPMLSPATTARRGSALAHPIRWTAARVTVLSASAQIRRAVSAGSATAMVQPLNPDRWMLRLRLSGSARPSQDSIVAAALVHPRNRSNSRNGNSRLHNSRLRSSRNANARNGSLLQCFAAVARIAPRAAMAEDAVMDRDSLRPLTAAGRASTQVAMGEGRPGPKAAEVARNSNRRHRKGE